MKYRGVLIGLIVLVLTAAAGGFAWRWYTTPVPPAVGLEGAPPGIAQAIRKALQGVRDRPRSALAWGDLSRLLIAYGFHDQAIACLRQTERLDPTDPCWPYLHGSVELLMARQQQGIPRLRQALALARGGEERIAVLFLLGQALVEDGQLEEAEQHLRELRALDGDSPRAHYGLGLLAVARDDRAAAREHLRRLVDHPCARRQVNSILATLSQGDEKLVRTYQERVKQLPPDVAWPNPFDEGVRATRVEDPQTLERYTALMAAGRRDEALAVLRDIVARSPNEAACFTLATTLVRQGRFEEAEGPLRQTLEFNPAHLKAHVLLAGALIEQAERRSPDDDRTAELYRRAAAAADRALSFQTDLALAHLVRGRALKALGKRDEALASLRRAALTGPEAPENHQYLGEALAEAGQLREALVHLENAVRVAPPDDPGPRRALEKWRAKAKPAP